MKNKRLQSNNKARGFTLIETLVAISILMLGVMGPLMIASSSLQNARYGRDQVTASYLAQEGIEYVRFARDNNKIDRLNGGSSDWLAGLESCFVDSAGDYGCAIDVPQEFGGTNVVRRCSNASCSASRMYLDSNGYYTHTSSGGNLSTFTRIVTIEPIVASTVEAEAKEVRVESTVTWRAGSATKTFTAVENVFNH